MVLFYLSSRGRKKKKGEKQQTAVTVRKKSWEERREGETWSFRDSSAWGGEKRGKEGRRRHPERRRRSFNDASQAGERRKSGSNQLRPAAGGKEKEKGGMEGPFSISLWAMA